MTEMEGYAAPHPRSPPFGISSGAVTATQFHVIHSSGGGYAFSPVLLVMNTMIVAASGWKNNV